jgi:hypothetical protein
MSGCLLQLDEREFAGGRSLLPEMRVSPGAAQSDGWMRLDYLAIIDHTQIIMSSLAVE